MKILKRGKWSPPKLKEYEVTCKRCDTLFSARKDERKWACTGTGYMQERESYFYWRCPMCEGVCKDE